MSTPPNNPDPRDPNTPQDPGAAEAPPRYGQRLPQPPQNEQGQNGRNQYPGHNPNGQSDQPYTAYGQPGPQQAGQQPSPYGQPYGQQPQSPYGYQAPQPSGYTYPGADGRFPGAKGPAPREVLTGFWLILAAGFLALVSIIVTTVANADAPLSTVTPDEREMIENSGVSEEMLSSTFVGAGVILGVIVFLVYLLVAVLIRKGKNWARILGTVFAAMSAVSVLLNIMAAVSLGVSLDILYVLSALLGIAGIVMLYRPPSQPYFRSQPRFGPY